MLSVASPGGALMERETRRLALRQAAKMVLGAAFVGCGGAMAAEAPPDAASDGRGAVDAKTAAHDAAAVSPKDAGLACDLTPEDAGISESSVACCLALTESATPDAGGFDFDPSPWAADPSLSGCCHALYEKNDHNLVSFVYGQGSHWRYDTCGICAKLVGDPVACTPWGPPVPPAMLEVA